jgi:hypothetical protein
MLTLELFGATVQMIGEVMVALTVITVHRRVMHDKKLDKAVIKEMRQEQWLGVIGVLCIILGFVLQLPIF